MSKKKKVERRVVDEQYIVFDCEPYVVRVKETVFDTLGEKIKKMHAAQIWLAKRMRLMKDHAYVEGDFDECHGVLFSQIFPELEREEKMQKKLEA